MRRDMHLASYVLNSVVRIHASDIDRGLHTPYRSSDHPWWMVMIRSSKARIPNSEHRTPVYSTVLYSTYLFTPIPKLIKITILQP